MSGPLLDVVELVRECHAQPMDTDAAAQPLLPDLDVVDMVREIPG